MTLILLPPLMQLFQEVPPAAAVKESPVMNLQQIDSSAERREEKPELHRLANGE